MQIEVLILDFSTSVDHQNITCDFEMPYQCGYSGGYGDKLSWKRYRGVAGNFMKQPKGDYTGSVLGVYVMTLSFSASETHRLMY